MKNSRLLVKIRNLGILPEMVESFHSPHSTLHSHPFPLIPPFCYCSEPSGLPTTRTGDSGGVETCYARGGAQSEA